MALPSFPTSEAVRRSLLIEAATAAAAGFDGASPRGGRGNNPRLNKVPHQPDGFVYRGPIRNPSFRPRQRSRSRSRSRERGDQRRAGERHLPASPKPSPRSGGGDERGRDDRLHDVSHQSGSRSRSRDEAYREDRSQQRRRLEDGSYRSRSRSGSDMQVEEMDRPSYGPTALTYHPQTHAGGRFTPYSTVPQPPIKGPVPPPRPPSEPYPEDRIASAARPPSSQRERSPYSNQPHSRAMRGEGEGSEEETDSAPSQRRHQSNSLPGSGSLPRMAPKPYSAPSPPGSQYGHGSPAKANEPGRPYHNNSPMRHGEGGGVMPPPKGVSEKRPAIGGTPPHPSGSTGGTGVTGGRRGVVGGDVAGEGSAGSHELPTSAPMRVRAPLSLAKGRGGAIPGPKEGHGVERGGSRGATRLGWKPDGGGGDQAPVDEETRLLCGEWEARPGEVAVEAGRPPGGRRGNLRLGPSTAIDSRGDGGSPQSFLALSMMQVRREWNCARGGGSWLYVFSIGEHHHYFQHSTYSHSDPYLTGRSSQCLLVWTPLQPHPL